MNILDYGLAELENIITAAGFPKFRAKQIFMWAAKGVSDISEMKNVPDEVFEKTGLHIMLPAILKMQESELDGTRKYLYAFEDGKTIESVFMRYKFGNSICVSSQAGCRMGCKFCASGLSGLERNLTAGEIYGQILAAERDTGEKISHIVVMGTGEPFDNYENLSKFIGIVNDKNGLNIGMRNITVSTCGIVPMIERFAEDFTQVNLAISLHGSTDEERSELMPINKVYPIAKLLEACRKYIEKTSRRITFEYTLVKGKNDDEKHAESLAKLLRGMLCHVNLIPLNTVDETGFFASSGKTASEFRSILEKRGIPATVRRELGDDIDAACGQLRLNSEQL